MSETTFSTTLDQGQIETFAFAIAFEVKKYLEDHRAEYERWIKKQKSQELED